MDINITEVKKEFSEKIPGIYEIRILISDNYSTALSAYVDYTNLDSVLQQIVTWKVKPGVNYNIYATVNPCKDYCKSREQYGKLCRTRITTQDDDIERITWLPIDIDPERPKGVSATDEEKRTAYLQAADLIQYLSMQGWDSPEEVDSGNGYHVKYRVDLPNDEEGRDIIDSALKKLHQLFPLVDTTAKNPSRVLKLPGTIAMKGRNTEDRPHRLSVIMGKATEVVNEQQ